MISQMKYDLHYIRINSKNLEIVNQIIAVVLVTEEEIFLLYASIL